MSSIEEGCGLRDILSFSRQKGLGIRIIIDF